MSAIAGRARVGSARTLRTRGTSGGSVATPTPTPTTAAPAAVAAAPRPTPATTRGARRTACAVGVLAASGNAPRNRRPGARRTRSGGNAHAARCQQIVATFNVDARLVVVVLERRTAGEGTVVVRMFHARDTRGIDRPVIARQCFDIVPGARRVADFVVAFRSLIVAVGIVVARTFVFVLGVVVIVVVVIVLVVFDRSVIEHHEPLGDLRALVIGLLFRDLVLVFVVLEFRVLELVLAVVVVLILQTVIRRGDAADPDGGLSTTTAAASSTTTGGLHERRKGSPAGTRGDEDGPFLADDRPPTDHGDEHAIDHRQTVVLARRVDPVDQHLVLRAAKQRIRQSVDLGDVTGGTHGEGVRRQVRVGKHTDDLACALVELSLLACVAGEDASHVGLRLDRNGVDVLTQSGGEVHDGSLDLDRMGLGAHLHAPALAGSARGREDLTHAFGDVLSSHLDQ
ncbi:MAG TPA: hypothetical protein VNJ54_06595, partial [Plantibacter sp.]|nr:hypothetical protein [Plantibacter sp.]